MRGERESARVSVVMPVYNGAQHLPECLDSVLGQTFGDFELLAVDDGSSDDSVAVLERCATQDRRVRVIRHAENRGHHHASNTALGHARGELVARMDQDDIWLPRRLEASVAHLDAHPEVGLLGSAYLRQRPDGSRVVRRPPEEHTAIRTHMVFGNVICHPSVTVRRSLAGTGELRYRDLPGPQDYDLWVRLLGHTRAHTLREPLVVYRESESSMTTLFGEDLPRAAAAISDRQLRELIGGHVGDDDLRAVRRLVSTGGPTSPDDHLRAGLVFDVFDALARQPDLDADAVRAQRRRWCRRALTRALTSRRVGEAQPFVREVRRRDPAVLASWLGREFPTRTIGRIRRRAGGPRAALAAR